MLSHVTVGTNDFKLAFEFYRGLMQQLGLVLKFGTPEQEGAAWRPIGRGRPLFFLTRPYDGQIAQPGNGQMLAFAVESHQRVDRCHAAALQAGGSNEGTPGLRPDYHPNYYGAYFRDLDGNKLAVACHAPAGRLQLRKDDLSSDAVQALLRLHLAGMDQNSPPGHVFALDLSGLQRPDVTVWTAWDGETVAGIAALRELPGGVGEVKSMRVHPDYLRQGVGNRLLLAIMAEAAAKGMTRLSLETGNGPAFDPALTLYRAHGFANGAAFSDYASSPYNQFLHLTL
jgi:putative acetyltransferase